MSNLWARITGSCWPLRHITQTAGIEHNDSMLVVFRTVCVRCGQTGFRYINRPGVHR